MLETTFREAYPLVSRAAQIQAAAAVSAGSLPSADRADLAQEGLLAFWRSLPFFDASRASIRTFAERVIANQITSSIRAHRAIRRTPVVTSTHAYSYHPAQSFDLRRDVERVIAALSDGDRRLAHLLTDSSPTEASRVLRISRSTVYQGIGRIKAAFIEAGL